jgi:hypothetical protein
LCCVVLCYVVLVVFVLDVCPPSCNKNRETITEEQHRATVVFVMDVCPPSCNNNRETITEEQQRATVVLVEDVGTPSCSKKCSNSLCDKVFAQDKVSTKPLKREKLTEQQRATVVLVMDVCPPSCNNNRETITEEQQRATVVFVLCCVGLC